MSDNRQIIVRELPSAELSTDHFELRTADRPVPGEGQVAGRTILMSIDAANRAWMAGTTYRDAVQVGDVMPTFAVLEVVESRDSSLKPGDLVAAESVWADYATVPAQRALRVSGTRPLTHELSVCGIAGKTAWHGLVGVGRPQAGETVVVSAAAGSVGMYVGQIARALGCRAVGIAGGPEKCDWVRNELRFDACVDYRDEAWARNLADACPDGIDIYFDNVGGSILETVLFQMNLRGRVVCCGAISQYNTDSPAGPRNVPGLIVVKRLRMEGFIVMDFRHDDRKAVEQLSEWVQNGTVRVFDDVVDGLENAPQALVGLLAGDNRGKRLVRVAPDPPGVPSA